MDAKHPSSDEDEVVVTHERLVPLRRHWRDDQVRCGEITLGSESNVPSAGSAPDQGSQGAPKTEAVPATQKQVPSQDAASSRDAGSTSTNAGNNANPDSVLPGGAYIDRTPGTLDYVKALGAVIDRTSAKLEPAAEPATLEASGPMVIDEAQIPVGKFLCKLCTQVKPAPERAKVCTHNSCASCYSCTKTALEGLVSKESLPKNCTLCSVGEILKENLAKEANKHPGPVADKVNELIVRSTMENVHTCPNKTCKTVYEFNATPWGSHFTCPLCQTSICAKCKQARHVGECAH